MDYYCSCHFGNGWETFLCWWHFLSQNKETFYHPRRNQWGLIRVSEYFSSLSKDNLCPQSGGDIQASKLYLFFHRKWASSIEHGGSLPSYATNPGQGGWEFYLIFHGMAFVRYSICIHWLHPSYEGLHNFWDSKSGFACDFSRFSFSLSSHNNLYCPQVVPGVHNLLWQQAHILQWLKVVKTMRRYIAHNMDGSEDLLASLETTKSKAAAA